MGQISKGTQAIQTSLSNSGDKQTIRQKLDALDDKVSSSPSGWWFLALQCLALVLLGYVATSVNRRALDSKKQIKLLEGRLDQRFAAVSLAVQSVRNDAQAVRQGGGNSVSPWRPEDLDALALRLAQAVRQSNRQEPESSFSAPPYGVSASPAKQPSRTYQELLDKAQKFKRENQLPDGASKWLDALVWFLREHATKGGPLMNETAKIRPLVFAEESASGNLVGWMSDPMGSAAVVSGLTELRLEFVSLLKAQAGFQPIVPVVDRDRFDDTKHEIVGDRCRPVEGGHQHGTVCDVVLLGFALDGRIVKAKVEIYDQNIGLPTEVTEPFDAGLPVVQPSSHSVDDMSNAEIPDETVEAPVSHAATDGGEPATNESADELELNAQEGQPRLRPGKPPEDPNRRRGGQ